MGYGDIFALIFSMNFLIISDNQILLERFDELLLTKDLYDLYRWDFACSKSNIALQEAGIILTEELMMVDEERMERISRDLRPHFFSSLQAAFSGGIGWVG
ncbi:MAG: hypothetical protein IPP77_09205 [Bacteroidetes bacterium]|nr:hypothetical protein [Bacteroidota bacterium]